MLAERNNLLTTTGGISFFFCSAVIFLASFHSPEVVFEQLSVIYKIPRLVFIQFDFLLYVRTWKWESLVEYSQALLESSIHGFDSTETKLREEIKETCFYGRLA